MKLKIIIIEKRLVTCEISSNGLLLNIARRWFSEDIAEGDIIEIDVSKGDN